MPRTARNGEKVDFNSLRYEKEENAKDSPRATDKATEGQEGFGMKPQKRKRREKTIAVSGP